MTSFSAFARRLLGCIDVVKQCLASILAFSPALFRHTLFKLPPKVTPLGATSQPTLLSIQEFEQQLEASMGTWLEAELTKNLHEEVLAWTTSMQADYESDLLERMESDLSAHLVADLCKNLNDEVHACMEAEAESDLMEVMRSDLLTFCEDFADNEWMCKLER